MVKRCSGEEKHQKSVLVLVLVGAGERFLAGLSTAPLSATELNRIRQGLLWRCLSEAAVPIQYGICGIYTQQIWQRQLSYYYNAVSVKDDFPVFEMSGQLARRPMKFQLKSTCCYA